MRTRCRIGAIAMVALALAAAAPAAADDPPTPPGQPETGPGGSDAYVHAGVRKKSHGEGVHAYWLYEPIDPVPTKPVPVIAFNHGWGGMNPGPYGKWIDHIVRRGAVVIYPRYQESFLTPPAEVNGNAIAAIKAALARLAEEERHAPIDTDRFAAVGHSAGGQITASLAALAAENELPKVRAIFCVEPGSTRNPFIGIPLADLSKVPAETLVVALAGEVDLVTGDHDAKRIYAETTAVPAKNKNLLLLRSDDHGEPPLVANHFAPIAGDEAYDDGSGRALSRFLRRLRRGSGGGDEAEPADDGGGVDALDWYGMWKIFDALCDAAFEGKNREHALGDTPEQRFMGEWSDGTPVRELKVVE